MEAARMAYPDWVLKYKEPGWYVQIKDQDTYRIYRGHSERRPGKPYPVLVTDEYIGTITREAGLVRTPVNLKGAVRVKRYGGFCLLLSLCRPLADGLHHRHGDHSLFLDACMRVLYGHSSALLYESDWMSEQHPGLVLPIAAGLESESARVATGMASTLQKHFGTETRQVLDAAGCLYRVWINNQWVASSTVPAAAVTLRYGLTWEVC
jgi:hypothetical protein